MDAKILSQIVAKRLDLILPTIKHPVQQGVIMGRSAVANIRKVIIALERSRSHPEEDLVVIALDAEKAFDSINLSWLFEVLH